MSAFSSTFGLNHQYACNSCNRRSVHTAALAVPSNYNGFYRSESSLGSRQCPETEGFIQTVATSVASVSSSSGPRRRVTRMMPIGVPRVPFRSRKAGGWQWIDIWNCLYRERIIFLGQALDEELGNQLIGTMLYLDSENHKDLRLYINCTGGDLVPSLALHDTMKHVESQVATVGFGACMGMSGFLLATGQKGKRVALPKTCIMLHHPSGGARGQAIDLHNEARELMRLRNYVNRVLSDATGQPIERIQFDFNRNKYFSADAAVEYGVIDRIIYPPRQRLVAQPQ